MHFVETPQELAQLVKDEPHVRVCGGGTKSAASGAAQASVAKLSGVLKYDPDEFTFSALAGTRLDEIESILAEKNQFLPFDPPLAERGATLGGTVAAGLSGSGRYRFGGVRDFLIGARIISGEGKTLTTGSQVVKNSAGFDFPKLMVGGQGCFGLLTELTFKVFPCPQYAATVVLEADGPEHGLQIVRELAGSQLDLACLDLDAEHRVWARLCGFRSSVPLRAKRALRFVKAPGRVLTDVEDAQHWRECREFRWLPEGHWLVKLATTPSKIARLTTTLGDLPRRFCVGGNLAWIGWPADLDVVSLDRALREAECSGIFVTGQPASLYVGPSQDGPFSQRLRAAMDPHNKFALPITPTA